MIFAIIDLLEKLLEWLRPFATKADKPTASEEEADQTDLRSGSGASLFGAVRPEVTPISSVFTNATGDALPADDARDRLSRLQQMGDLTLTTIIPDLPVVTYLKGLMADKKINKKATKTAAIYLRGTNTLIFGPIKADPKVWNIIYHHYGNEYTFQ